MNAIKWDFYADLGQYSDIITNPWGLYDNLIDEATYNITHDDVIKWKHFRRYCPFLWGIHRSPVNPPHKGQ